MSFDTHSGGVKLLGAYLPWFGCVVFEKDAGLALINITDFIDLERLKVPKRAYANLPYFYHRLSMLLRCVFDYHRSMSVFTLELIR